LRFISQSLDDRIQANDKEFEGDPIEQDYVEGLQQGRYYIRNDFINAKLEECGLVDAYVAKIQNLLLPK
jgi:hypothetical protein